MSSSYRYIDTNYTYIDSQTGILRNLLDISDPEVLIFVESSTVTKRLQELYSNPIQISGVHDLFQIHQILFQDIYAWAGEKRKVEISKDGKQFFPINFFDTALKYIDSLIAEYYSISRENKEDLAFKLAEILDNINYLHPFREGNGRVQREFIRLLALEKGYNINLNPPENRGVYERYMKGTIESRVDIINDLILDLINGNEM